MHLLVICWLCFLGSDSPAANDANPQDSTIPAQASLRGAVDLEESRMRLQLTGRFSTVSIELRKELEGWLGDPRQGKDAESSSRRTQADEKGVFRFTGLSPGAYSLIVRSGNLRPIERRDLRIEADQETVLAEPLTFEKALQLTTRLTPVADPWQRPWTVQLYGSDPGSRWQRLVAEAVAGADGLAVLRDLDPREARLEVRDANDRTWLEVPVEIYPERPELFLDIPVVAVEGRLTLGDDPLAGKLSFGTTQGGTDIRMESGDNGKFQGYLPNEGRWAVELFGPGGEYEVQRLRDVEVRRRPGKSHAEVEIRVPPTTLNGKVLFAGEPVAGAGVNVVRERSPAERRDGENGIVREAMVQTDAEGRFRLRGIEPGALSVQAGHGRRSSEWVRLDLQEGAWPPEIVLELEERERLLGLVAFGPAPVAGARLVALPKSQRPGKGSSYLEAATGPGGDFELAIPASATSLDLLVAAPSLGIDLVRIEKKGGVWAPAILQLSSERGTLRSPVSAGEPASRDFADGLLLRRNGAALRLKQVVRVLAGLNQLELVSGAILLQGLAAGGWDICRESDPQSCRGGTLPAHGELELSARLDTPNSPRPGALP